MSDSARKVNLAPFRAFRALFVRLFVRAPFRARSPYDGSLFQYDESKKELRFTGKGRHNMLPGDKKTLVIDLGT